LKTDSFDQNGIKKGRIGIFASNDLDQWPQEIVIKKKENLVNAFLSGFTETYKFTNLIMVSIGKMITGSVSAENIGGPIQISVLAGSAAKAGLLSFLSMIAILSINLGLINLFPIPVLDGGQLLLIAIEKVKGSPVSENFLEHSIKIGVVLIASLMIFAFVNDIVRLI
jgi:regulator of sigma E protease